MSDENPIEEIQRVHEADKSDIRFQNKIIRQLRVTLGIIVVMIGIALGITTYNSVNNAPKIECIYQVSIGTNHDISHLLHGQKNPKDYPEVKCG